MLHIINQSNNLDNCLKLISGGHAVLLIEDGVLAVLSNTAELSKIDEVYVLEEDLIARGIRDKVPANMRVIDYDGFVDLVMHYHPVQSW